MDVLGQRVKTHTCPHCGGDTVVFDKLSIQRCDNCEQTFER